MLANFGWALAVVVAWIHSDCLDMKQFKCALQQSELLAKTMRIMSIIPHDHAIAKAVNLEIHNVSHVGVEWTVLLQK